MSDVFISYARSTADQAQQVAEALRALGYGVWRDDDLPAHRAYAEVIEERLAAARAVVVIWSAEAAKSEWVQSEADQARAARKLVQLTLDGAKLPMPFDRIQCADLVGWTGDLEAPGWRKVAASVADLLAARDPAAIPVQPPAVAGSKSTAPLLAVLPFDNLSGDPEMAYFSDGVSEEIQQTVARTTTLQVIGRGSSFQFRGPDKAAAHVAAALDATHVLDGSVRRAGPKVRISAQLVECTRGVTLWSERFDRDLSDIFALQDEIAAAVAAALNAAFARATPFGRIDPAAYELFLRAKAHPFSPDDPAPTLDRLQMLDQVVIAAPDFSAAWAEVALARVQMLRWWPDRRPIGLTRASVIDAAETALRLDPGAAAAYVALAYLEPFAAYARKEGFEAKGLAAAPNHPRALVGWGTFCYLVGRYREGLGYTSKAKEIDPLSENATFWTGCMLPASGRYPESRDLWAEALARAPETGRYWFGAFYIAAGNGDWVGWDDLLVRWGAMLAELGERRLPGGMVVRDQINFGRELRTPDPARLARRIERARQSLASTGTVDLSIITALAALGAVDEVYELVEKASFAHMFDPDGPPPSQGNNPGHIFDLPANRLLLSDPRFVGLCAKLGLVDYWTKTERWPDCADEGVLPYEFKAEARRLAAA